MDLERRLALITRNTEEVVTEEELRKKLETGERLEGYLGYEPSGLFHIGWVIWAYKVKDLVEAGVNFRLLEATWHAMINDKFGGNLELIRGAAKYIRHGLKALGTPIEKIKFIDAEELVGDKDYWELVLRVAKNTSLARAKRALTIMGRKEDEAELDSSKIIYPFMQVTDIYYMNLDVALGGMDQRKAHMLARELAEKLGKKKVVAIHTPLLTSLKGKGRAGGGGTRDEELAEAKMSKSSPDSTILIHDSEEEIERKLLSAYCPKGTIEFNPVLEINKYILFYEEGFTMTIDRPPNFGGPLEVNNYNELEKLFIEGKIHPLDLKKATARELAKRLKPVREYFRTNQEAKKLAEEIARYYKLELTI
ncbi:MAG: tyrosine--tRNA ligase [Fervidicoccaceae archaeon]|jgi:tyrosyl-tRNA synthetase